MATNKSRHVHIEIYMKASTCVSATMGTKSPLVHKLGSSNQRPERGGSKCETRHEPLLIWELLKIRRAQLTCFELKFDHRYSVWTWKSESCFVYRINTFIKPLVDQSLSPRIES